MDYLSVSPVGMHSVGMPAVKARTDSSRPVEIQPDLNVGSLKMLTQDTVSFGSKDSLATLQNVKKQFAPKNLATALSVDLTPLGE